MNLVYKYIMQKTKTPYQEGKTYLLLRNCDTENAYVRHARIHPGECFILEKDEAYDLLHFILYDKKVVVAATIQDT